MPKLWMTLCCKHVGDLVGLRDLRSDACADKSATGERNWTARLALAPEALVVAHIECRPVSFFDMETRILLRFEGR